MSVALGRHYLGLATAAALMQAADAPAGATTADPAKAPDNPADAGGVFDPLSTRPADQGTSGSAQNTLGIGAADGVSPTSTPENLENPRGDQATADVSAALNSGGSMSGADAAATVPGTGTQLRDGEPTQTAPIVDGGLTGAQAATEAGQGAISGTATGAPSAPVPNAQPDLSTPSAPNVGPTEAPATPAKDASPETQAKFNEDMVAALERSNDQLTAMSEYTQSLSSKYDALVQRQNQAFAAQERAIEDLKKGQADQAYTFQRKLDDLAKRRVEITEDGTNPVVGGLVNRVERLFTHLGIKG